MCTRVKGLKVQANAVVQTRRTPAVSSHLLAVITRLLSKMMLPKPAETTLLTWILMSGRVRVTIFLEARCP